MSGKLEQYFQKPEEALKTIPKGNKPDPCAHEAETGDDSKELDATCVLFGECVGILYMAQAQDRPIHLAPPGLV